MDKIKQKNI